MKNIIDGLTTDEAIIYAQLGFHNMLHSANDRDTKNLKIFIKEVFELYPIVDKAIERAKLLKII